MSEVFNCVNCGKQNILMEDDPPDVKCEFPDKNGHRHCLKIKEGSMVEKINFNELKPKEKVKLGIDKIGAILHYDKKEQAFLPKTELPPIPPKPSIKGMKLKEGLMVLHRYYEENTPAILKYCAIKGQPATRVDWGFGYSGWKKFREKHGLPKLDGRGKERHKIKKARGGAAPVRTETKDGPGENQPKTGKRKDANPAPQSPVRFPAFNEKWDPEVKMTWLNTYGKLYEIDHKEN